MRVHLFRLLSLFTEINKLNNKHNNNNNNLLLYVVMFSF